MHFETPLHDVISQAIYNNFETGSLDKAYKENKELINQVNTLNDLGLTPLQYAIYLSASHSSYREHYEAATIFLNDLFLFITAIAPTFNPYLLSRDGQTAGSMAEAAGFDGLASHLACMPAAAPAQLSAYQLAMASLAPMPVAVASPAAAPVPVSVEDDEYEYSEAESEIDDLSNVPDPDPSAGYSLF